ncbi:BMP family lipoprotein [Nocardia sp. alder85J]|uniref:BMP family lipoprotein n=1 Tax=Nocardia sp. alder85J TaxID=2862949 RepID=UPI001CD247D8|nr:BMP family ABC transporter substrate-binding protein [Nocardia sp. alder85J]MCX4092863.1 BMP family ABC transporter substrate-binding protein [Nocardia sp. alder85J]
MPLSAAWLHANSIDAWWARAHDLARAAAQRHFGAAVTTTTTADLGEGEDWLARARTLAADGTDVIFVCDTAVAPLTRTVAAEFPATRFVHCQGESTGPNLTVYRAARDQHAYLSGMLAAAATATGVLGAVEGIRSPHDLLYTNAWALGARTVRPDVRILLHWAGSYRDPRQADKEHAAVTTLIGHGADVIGGNLTENPATVHAALAAGPASAPTTIATPPSTASSTRPTSIGPRSTSTPSPACSPAARSRPAATCAPATASSATPHRPPGCRRPSSPPPTPSVSPSPPGTAPCGRAHCTTIRAANASRRVPSSPVAMPNRQQASHRRRPT